MGLTDKMWDGISRVIRMDTKVEGLATVVKEQQIKIEHLTARVIRLETALEIALSNRGRPMPNLISHDIGRDDPINTDT